MGEHSLSVIAKYSGAGCLRHLGSYRNNEPFGPELDFRDDGSLEAVYIRLGKRSIGTTQAWIDTGDMAWQSYCSPNLSEAWLTRTYVAELLDVEESIIAEGAEEGAWRRWRASELDSPASEFFPTCRGPVALWDGDAEGNWRPSDPDFFGRFTAKWPNGQLAYYGEYDFDFVRSGATVTFWESGAVRTLSTWRCGCAVGTRSCFTSDGRLAAEQYFHKFGAEKGNWVNRYFGWEEETARLSKVEIVQDFRISKVLYEPSITCVLDEASLNRYVDPLYDSLRELSDCGDDQVEGEEVDWSKHY